MNFFCDFADDSMAILMAFRCPEVEVVGLTTVFGNAATEDSTRNALLLVCIFCFFFLK
jgi:uridine nucleosidase